MIDLLSNLMRHVVIASLQAGLLALLIGTVILLFRGQLSPRWRHGLWWLVVLRLALPILPTSPVSVYQWLPTPSDVSPSALHNHAELSLGDTLDTQASEKEESFATAITPTMLTSEPLPAPLPALEIAGDLPPPKITSAALPETTNAPLLQPTTPQRQATTPYTLWRIASIAWLTIAGLLLGRTVVGWVRLCRRLQRETLPAPSDAVELLKQETERLGLKTPPTLLETSAVHGPVLVGVFRPKLLLPTGLTKALDTSALRLILRHELCHLRGQDNLANWLLTTLIALHWFNPLAWWAAGQLRRQRELARDAQTVQADHTSIAAPQHDTAQQYAEALLAIVRFTLDSATPPRRVNALSSAAVRDRKHLSRRLAMLEHVDRFGLRHRLFACVLLVAVASVGLTTAQGDETIATEEDTAVAQEQPAVARIDEPQAAQDETPQALRQQLDISWEKITFPDALADLEDQVGLSITFDPVIQEAIDAIEPKRPVVMHLTDVPLESALQLLLDQQFEQRMDEALPPVEMRWTIRDNALHLMLETHEPRVYDIRDLLIVRQPDLAEAPWDEEKIAQTRQGYVGQVKELIETTVGDTRHWTKAFAKTEFGGTITELNGNLIIQTTPTNHRTILRLFERLRKTRGWMISFETKVMLLDDETFQEVFSEDVHIERWSVSNFRLVHPGRRQEQADDQEEASPHPNRSDLAYGVAGYVWPSEERVASLIKRVSAPGRHNFVLDHRLLVFNGQPASVGYAKQQPYVSGYNAADQSNDLPHLSDDFEPVLSVAESGALLLLEAVISSDRKHVTLKTALEVAAEAGPPQRMPVPKVQWADENRTFVEVPQVDYSALRTNWWSQPDQSWMLMVGPTVRGKIGQDDPDDYTDARRIVLLIKPKIIELQEQEAEVDENSQP